MRSFLKRISILKIIVVSLKTIRHKFSLIKRINLIYGFFYDYRKYKKLDYNKNSTTYTSDLYPRIYDKTKTTEVDPVYFYQNSWCAKKIFENNPKEHFDVGSDLKMLGIISQFTPTTMVDIRPPAVNLPELNFIKGDILKLPFRDGAIDSLSSICVIEHIGLGRYGDPLDQFGTEKSVKELKRILSNKGNLYISVPIDAKNTVYFNAHRAFTRKYVLELFSPLSLIEERYIYGNEMSDEYNQDKGFGTGLYHFAKNQHEENRNP